MTNRYQSTNNFSAGMNSDVDKSILAKNQYLYSENFRLFGNSGNTVGSLENVIGNTILTDIIPSGYGIAGYCNIRDELYLFITQNTSPSQSGYSQILKVTIINGAVSSYYPWFQDEFTLDGSRLHLAYGDQTYQVKAVGRYESPTIKKIYWVDGYNPVRSMDVTTGYDPISTPSVTKFDIIPDFNLSEPVFNSWGTGKLTSGKIQYAYQMYDLYGSETLFSTACPLISISETSGQTGSNKSFKGSDIDVDTGKGIRISILPPSGFNRIRVISIKYNSINSIPIISIVADQSISSTPTTTYFYDTGNSNLGSYTYEEFAIVGKVLVTASEIETKDNYLFVGNIEEDVWDIDYDARAYRFVKSGSTGEVTPGHSALYTSSSLTSYKLLDSNFHISGVDVGETENCINPYNDFLLDNLRNDNGTAKYQGYKYQLNGTTIGGSGKNVRYSFTYQEVIISESGTNYSEDYCYNTDYSNTNVEVNFVGYQRDEVYRFGIVFFNEKGQSSTVKWIGDIRFPYAGEGSYAGQYDIATVSGTTTTARLLGIEFSIDVSSTVALGAKYFKIVRCERTSIDRTILAQGVVCSSMFFYKVDESGYSFRPFLLPYTCLQDIPGITKVQEVLEFISPEINFNKNLTYQSGDILEFIGTDSIVRQYDNIAHTSVTVGNLPNSSEYSYTMKYLDNVYYSTSKNAYFNILNFLIVDPCSVTLFPANSDGVDIGASYKVVNYTDNLSNSAPYSHHYGISGTKGFLRM